MENFVVCKGLRRGRLYIFTGFIPKNRIVLSGKHLQDGMPITLKRLEF